MSQGITGIRNALAEIPGSHTLIMRYEKGGFIHAFSIGDVTVRLGPLATNEEIKAAFQEAMGLPKIP